MVLKGTMVNDFMTRFLLNDITIEIRKNIMNVQLVER